jgi:hypothetical protein
LRLCHFFCSLVNYSKVKEEEIKIFDPFLGIGIYGYIFFAMEMKTKMSMQKHFIKGATLNYNRLVIIRRRLFSLSVIVSPLKTSNPKDPFESHLCGGGCLSLDLVQAA